MLSSLLSSMGEGGVPVEQTRIPPSIQYHFSFMVTSVSHGAAEYANEIDGFINERACLWLIRGGTSPSDAGTKGGPRPVKMRLISVT